MNKNLYYILKNQKIHNEKLEAEKLAAEKLEAEKLEAEKLEAEKLLNREYISSIIFDNKIRFTKSDNIIINALRKKDVKIDIKDYINISNYEFAYNLETYICMSNVLRNILKKFNKKDTILFLKNLFKNEEVVIISSGPSSANVTDTELKYLSDNYITICVKYVLEFLLQKDIKPTFFVNNLFLSKNNFNFYDNLSKDLTTIIATFRGHPINSNYNQKNNYLIIINNKGGNLNHNFNLLKKNVNCISWNIDKDYNISHIPLHIMCEIAIPLCIHLGVSKIFTVGWDLKNINNKAYIYDDMKNPVYNDINKTSLPVEYESVPYIKKILNDKNIEIYKIKESPILLEYKNIFI